MQQSISKFFAPTRPTSSSIGQAATKSEKQPSLREVITIDSSDDEDHEKPSRTSSSAALTMSAQTDTHELFALEINQEKRRAFSKCVGEAFASPTQLSSSSSSSSSIQPANKRSKTTYTPLEQQVVLLKEKYPDFILMVECGYRLRFFGIDAEVAAQKLGIQHRMDHNFQVASVPTYRFLFVRQTETASLRRLNDKKSSTTFSREVVARYTPATAHLLSDDDPRFASLLNASSLSSPATGDEDDEHDTAGDDDEDPDSMDSLDSTISSSMDDSWLCAISETTATKRTAITAGVIFLNLQANVMRCGVMSAQRLGPLLDIIRPVEAITVGHLSATILDQLAQRSGSSAMQYIRRIGQVSNRGPSDIFPDLPVVLRDAVKAVDAYLTTVGLENWFQSTFQANL
jgi:MutS domain I